MVIIELRDQRRSCQQAMSPAGLVQGYLNLVLTVGPQRPDPCVRGRAHASYPHLSVPRLMPEMMSLPETGFTTSRFLVGN